MSLSKNLCHDCLLRNSSVRACVEEEKRIIEEALDATGGTHGYAMIDREETFEAFWRRGVVYCSVSDTNGLVNNSFAKTDGFPPEWCPYSVEQILED